MELLAGAVRADHADRHHPGAERVHVVGRVRRAAEQHLALGESQDEHRRLARDAGRLAEEILVGDQIAEHDDDRPVEPIDDRPHSRSRHGHDRWPSIAHPTAPSRSSATWSGVTGSVSRRYSHSPSP